MKKDQMALKKSIETIATAKQFPFTLLREYYCIPSNKKIRIVVGPNGSGKSKYFK